SAGLKPRRTRRSSVFYAGAEKKLAKLLTSSQISQSTSFKVGWKERWKIQLRSKDRSTWQLEIGKVQNPRPTLTTCCYGATPRINSGKSRREATGPRLQEPQTTTPSFSPQGTQGARSSKTKMGSNTETPKQPA